jgi:hypothetical protein
LGFFDFVADIPPYSRGNEVARLNKRRDMIIEPFRDTIAGARVLDLGAHDGRWSYALAGAGAASVIGIEARSELFERFQKFPDAPFKGRIDLRQGDFFRALRDFNDADARFDVVAVYGIFYHIMDHFHMLRMIRALRPKLVIVDGEFIDRPNPMIQLIMEKTDQDLNAAPQHEGQEKALIGIPSFLAMDRMARALDYAIDWVDAEAMFGADRMGIQDYFRNDASNKKRATCWLTPNG